jgi:general secretion pathway protein C
LLKSAFIVYIDGLMLNENYLLNKFRDERTWILTINFCLAVLLAYTMASLTWKIFPESQTDNDISYSRSFNSFPSTSKQPLSEGLPEAVQEELPLFGKATRDDRASTSRDPDSFTSPETSLALILKGVVVASPMSRALVVITEQRKGSIEQLYGIGDKVPGNAIVSEIFADRVILRRGGVLETLFIQDKMHATKRGRQVGRSVAADSGGIANRGDGIHWQIDSSYLNRRLSDIPSLAREVGVEIYKENNVQKGYRLVSARGSKLLRDMGLQPGDILREVNGVPLNSIHDGLSAYQKLRSVSEVRVVISRNGRRETRIYEINNGG